MSATPFSASVAHTLAVAIGIGQLLVSPTGHALPLGLDGSWFDPAHSGHGLTVERIDADRALLFWHTFDPQGRPLTLYIDARVEGESLRGQALAPQGLRFGVFDPQTLQLPEWGEVSLRFSDCQNATLSWRGTLPGYGEGEASMQRLLPLDDPGCSLAAPVGLADMDGHEVRGDVLGSFTRDADDAFSRRLHVSGHVDAEGVLRATVEPFSSARASETPVLIGEPLPSASGRATLQVRYLRNRLGDLLDQYFGEPTGESEGGDFLLQLSTRAAPRSAAAYDFTGRGAEVEEIDIRVSSRERQPPRPGSYGDPTRGLLTIADDGGLCLRIIGDPGLGPCRFTGRILDEGRPSFRFELRESGGDPTPYRGSGVARVSGDGALISSSVTLIADNGTQGFYFEASRSFLATD